MALINYKSPYNQIGLFLQNDLRCIEMRRFNGILDIFNGVLNV